MPDRFSGDRATQAPVQRSSEKEPMDERKAADGAREHDGMQPEAASASARSGNARGAKAWREGKQAERASEGSSTPRQSALAKLELMLAKLDKPWTILRERQAGSNGRALGVAFVGLHPEKGIALIDVEPARPSHAVAGLRVALLRAQSAGFTVREPPIVPVVLSRDEIPNLAGRIEAAFAEMRRCAIQNRDWPDLAVASLTAEHPQLVLVERRPKAAPAAPSSSRPEAAKRAERPPITVEHERPTITVERDARGRGKGSSTSQEEARPAAAAQRRDPAPGGEVRRANGSSAYPSLLRRPNVEPPRIDAAQLDMSRLMRNLKPPRTDIRRTDTPRADTQSRPNENRPPEREQHGSSPEIRDATGGGPVPPPPTARVIALDRIFDPEWNPTYPPNRRGGRGWTIAGAISAMLAVLVVLPPQAIGPGSSIHPTADAALHSDSEGKAAVQPPRFATGQGLMLGERPELREPAPPQDQHAMTAQEPRPKEGVPPAPAMVDVKPPAMAPSEAVRPAPDTNVANAAKEPAETRAPAKTASAEGAGDRASPAATKPVQRKPSSASARPSPAARKSAPKDSQKAKELQEASGGAALPSPAARTSASKGSQKAKDLKEASSGIGLPLPGVRNPAQTDDKKAQGGQDTSGEMKYVEGREPRILGTITSTPSADSADVPRGNDVTRENNDVPQGNMETRPISRGPLSPATDFSITPEGVMAPSGVVMPFDRQ
jgi:hypothetical protein